MNLRIALPLLGGTLVGAIAGLHSPAEALSCACIGETLHLELVSGPDVPCAEGEADCTSEWVEAPVLQKDDYGLSGDLLNSGYVYLSRGGE